MVRTCTFNKLGLCFVVDVEYEEDDNKVSAYGVNAVAALKADNTVVMLKCDTERFYKDFEGEIQEALEEEIRDLMLVKADMLYDQMKEEGRL